MKPRRLKLESGFTLIELMIVVAIVGILASIAYPSYQAYLQRGWRAEGKSAAMAAAQQMERFFTMRNTYNAANLAATGISDKSCTEGTCRYKVSVVAGPTGDLATSYTVQLAPTGWTDSKCGTLTLTSDGTKGSSGSMSTADCWKK